MTNTSVRVKVYKPKKMPKALTYIEHIRPSLSTDVEIDLMDKENVVGVSFCPGKRKWRAYLHQGQKQVFHGYYDTKSEAIAARAQAVIKLERVGTTRKVFPAFERTIKPPKYREMERTLEHLAEEAAEVIHVKSKIVRFGLKDRMKGQDFTNQERIGREIGNMLAIVELLIMSGDVRPADIEEGMKKKVESLQTMY